MTELVNGASYPAHVLFVHDDPEDDFDIVHPDACSYRIDRDPFSHAPVLEYTCLVGVEHQEAGLGAHIRHLLDPWTYRGDGRQPLTPGTYWLWMSLFKSRCWDCWDGYEYEITTDVVPQPALLGA